MKWGRGEGEWEELARVGRAFLEERARIEGTTNYTELDGVLSQRTGYRQFDFDREDERAAMGYLLGLIVEDSFAEARAILSALVLYLNENAPGPGFFNLAQQMGLLPPGASGDSNLAFWADQVTRLYDHYRENVSHRRPSDSSSFQPTVTHDCKCVDLPASWGRCGKTTQSTWSVGCDGTMQDKAREYLGFRTRLEFIEWVAEQPSDALWVAGFPRPGV